jgi:hypothetical protein
MYTILSEEYPQEEDVSAILSYMFKKDIPEITYDVRSSADGNWLWKFGITGFEDIEVGFMKGSGSVCDYIVLKDDQPHLFVEATQTTETESRNTAFGQRATKFIVAREYYPDVPFIYIYSQRHSFNTPSAQFCARLYRTHNVPIFFREDCKTNLIEEFQPFETVEQIIDSLNSIPKKKGNVPLTLKVGEMGEYEINARLSKGLRTEVASDPNIGMVSLISSTLKKLCDDVRIKVTGHGVTKMCRTDNKFMIANRGVDLYLDGLYTSTKNVELKGEYFKPLANTISEKCSTILFHILAKTCGFEVIFHNHAGSARSKLLTSNGLVSVPKKTTIPDLVLRSLTDNTIYIIEGKVQRGYKQGKKQLAALNEFEELLVRHYKGHVIDKGVCLSVDNIAIQYDSDVLFVLDSTGNYS